MKQENRRIGQMIKEARKTRGMTQMELSELIGVSYQQVQKYEKGSDNISVERLKQIAKAVLVPVSLFFPATAEIAAEASAVYVRTPKLQKDEAELLRLYQRIKAKKAKKAVIELLKTFTEA
jgi:transcriptional regulator with XRE-family HTH domain